jgi:hypothetical protein
VAGKAPKVAAAVAPMTHDGIGDDGAGHRYDDADDDLRDPIFHPQCDDLEIRHHQGEVSSEFLDLNHASKSGKNLDA